MKIALIHYHLKRGGVTTVIRHQVEAIQSMGWDPLVISGEPLAATFPCDVQVVEGLAYDRYLPPGLTANSISDALMGIFKRKWTRMPDVLHVHNPTLAKNKHLQDVLRELQQNRISILCQIHDFAEDGRPDAYYNTPYIEDCHYVAINSRDHRLLQDAGLRTQGCHLLPNAISFDPIDPDGTPDRNGVLYPVRAIRRKNIGEAILLSLFLDAHGPLVITLPPNSPKDFKSYRHWKGFVRRHDVPVRFDAGLAADFSSLMAGCRFVITTSITEGFGFTFLEAWSAGKALWGRLLPDVCQDFMDHGLRLDWLYRHLWVPLTWLDRDMLKLRWTSALSAARRQFDLPSSEEILETAWQRAGVDDRIDFGILDEHFQTEVIKRVLGSVHARERLMALNAFLKCPGPPDQNESMIVANAQAIDRYYRAAAYAGRLEDVYRHAASIPVHHRLDKGLLAEAFLSSDQFSLLKWGECHG